MDALVMAGGSGRRMGGTEKPILPLKGKPLLSYVLEALLKSSIGHVFVALSPGVPETAEYVKREYGDNERITLVNTPGSGYIQDTVYAVEALGLYRPFLILSADLPMLTPGIIDSVVGAYGQCGKDALSVRVDASVVKEKPDIILTDQGFDTVPAGVNVVNGAHMDRYQEEFVMVVNDPGLAVNVNYKKDLAMCEKLLAEKDRQNR